MKTKEIAKKLYNLLKHDDYTRVFFDHKSYDDAEDIPHITINNKRYNVNSVRISEKGSRLDIYCEEDLFSLDLDNLPKDYTDTYLLDDCNLYSLFMNIYYENNKSYIIGDFECDFLGKDFEN